MKNGNSIFHLGGPRHDAGKQAWSSSELLLEAWKDGMTGYPFVDANMRELKASGFMSNRGRQVVASFFTKDLAMDWRLGAEHFEEHLLDHDPASNWGNWNYVAGVGSDPREDRYFNVSLTLTAHIYSKIRKLTSNRIGSKGFYLFFDRKRMPGTCVYREQCL